MPFFNPTGYGARLQSHFFRGERLKNLVDHLPEQSQVKLSAIITLDDGAAWLLLLIVANDQPCVTHGPGGQHFIAELHHLGLVRLPVP
jgi:hypothetical protein